MELKGRTVVVTGASQGIGEKLAERFAEAGATVLVAARSADKLAAVAERIGGEWIAVDLGDPDQVDGFAAACLAKLGQVDVLVNNAGVETTEAFVAVERDRLRAVARLNYEATVLLTRDFLTPMLARGTGHIVQMSSLAGAIPFPGLAVYAGTKAGLTNFTETLRLELRRTGVGLTVVSPGPVDTDMWARLDTDSSPYPRPALKRFRHLLFLPKVTPDEIAVATVRAVERNHPHVRLARRFNGFHYLNNAPRRLAGLALTGVRLRLPPG
jgi:short-subunit dehydrogenase